VTRILEFRIIVNSGPGCPVCGKALVKATAKQTLVMVNGHVDEAKSKFETPNPDDK
jgi:hydrogenase maturation factor